VQAQACGTNPVGLELELGRLWWLEGQPEAARPWLQRHLERVPDDRDAHLQLARVQVALGQADLADPHYQKVMATGRAIPDLIVEWAQVRRDALADPLGALQVVDSGLSEGASPALDTLAVELERALGRYDDALARIDASLARSPRDLRLRVLRGDVLRDAGHGSEARAAWKRVVADYDALPVRLQNDRMRAHLDAAVQRLGGS